MDAWGVDTTRGPPPEGSGPGTLDWGLPLRHHLDGQSNDGDDKAPEVPVRVRTFTFHLTSLFPVELPGGFPRAYASGGGRGGLVVNAQTEVYGLFGTPTAAILQAYAYNRRNAGRFRGSLTRRITQTGEFLCNVGPYADRARPQGSAHTGGVPSRQRRGARLFRSRPHVRIRRPHRTRHRRRHG